MLTQWWKSRAAGSSDPGAHAVEIDSVTYKFGDHRAVDNLSLVINAGSVSACSVPTAQERLRRSGCSTRYFLCKTVTFGFSVAQFVPRR